MQVASRKSQVASRKSQVASSKLLSFLTLLSLLFSSPTFAASSSSLGASALGEISIGLSDYDVLAAKCVDIISYEEIMPDVCADFIDDESLEIAINSYYRFEENPPEVRGSWNSQTIAAQINYDAKQAYLDKIESEAAARASENAQGLIAYNSDQVGYVEFSSDHGLSASVKGVKVVADNKLNTPKNIGSERSMAWKVGLVLAAAAVVATAFSQPKTTKHGPPIEDEDNN